MGGGGGVGGGASIGRHYVDVLIHVACAVIINWIVQSKAPLPHLFKSLNC